MGKRKTRKQKERQQVRRDRAADQAARARDDLRQLIASEPASASADDLSRAVALGVAADDSELMVAATEWACHGKWDDGSLSTALWEASAELGSRARVRTIAALLLTLSANGRGQASTRLAEQLASPLVLSAAIRGDVPEDALRLAADWPNEPWVADLLQMVAFSDTAEPAPADDVAAEVRGAGEVAYAEEFWNAGGGAFAIRGFDYQSEVGLLWLIRSLDHRNHIQCVGFELVQDIEVRFDGDPLDPSLGKFAPHVLIQAKTRSETQGAWTLRALSSSDVNVLPRFAELHVRLPDAKLLFVSNRQLSRDALALSSVCEKIREAGLGLIQLLELDEASPHHLNTAERNALQTLRRLLAERCPSDDELSGFLRDLYFETTSGELRAEAVGALGEATNTYLGIARLQHAVLYRQVFERSKHRQFVSREEAGSLVDRVKAQVQATVGNATDASALVRELDFSTRCEPDTAYSQGVRARLRHILAGQDIVREEVMRNVTEALVEDRVCVLRSPSGQGKSTCMYRWAHEHHEHFRVYELGRVDSPLAAEAIEGVLRAEARRADRPILLLADDLFDGEKREMPHLLDLLDGHDGVYVLGTSREDQWRNIRPKGLSVRPVWLELTAQDARGIADGLIDGGLEPELAWEDAYERSQTAAGEHLLMEFLHYFRRGRSLEETLREQVESLPELCGDASHAADTVLRCVATADRFGSAVSRGALQTLAGSQQHYLDEAVRVLKDEHLLVERGDDAYVSLHPLRSSYIADFYAEIVPIQHTARELVTHLSEGHLTALLEWVLADDRIDPATITPVVAERIARDLPPETLPAIFEAVFAAEQRRFAAVCHKALDGIDVRTSLARLLPSERLPSGEQIGIFDRIPCAEDTRRVVEALPERGEGDRLLSGLFDACGLPPLVSAVEKSTALAAAVLDWTAFGNGETAKQLLAEAERDALVRRAETCGLDDLSLLGRVIARIDRDQAIAFFDRLGGPEALSARVLLSDYRVRALERISDDEWLCQWWATEEVPAGFPRNVMLAGARPEEESWALGEALIGLLPGASTVEVRPLDDTGGALGYGDYRPYKRIARDTVGRTDGATRNRLWSDIFLEAYRARTWAGFREALDSARADAVLLAEGLCTLLTPKLPVAPSQVTREDFGTPLNPLIRAGHGLHRKGHHLPIAPPAPAAASEWEHAGDLVDQVPTYFDRLLIGFEFLFDVMLGENDRSALLPEVNAGMAAFQQREMTNALERSQTCYEGQHDLAVREKRALAGFAGLARAATDPLFAEAKRIAKGCERSLKTLIGVLNAAADASTADSPRLLSHALNVASGIGERLPHASRIARVCGELGVLSQKAEPASERIADLLELCGDLMALDGVGLAAEAYDTLWIASWLDEAALHLPESKYPGAASINITIDLSPHYGKDGLRQLEVVALVAPRSFADVATGVAILLETLTESWSGPTSGRIIAVYEVAGKVIPETGMMMHCPNGETIFPFELEEGWLTDKGLESAEKPALVWLLENAMTTVISAASWIDWHSSEVSACTDGLEHRRDAIASECHRRVDVAITALSELAQAMAGCWRDAPNDLLASTDNWAADCADALAANLQAAADGEADREFLNELAALREGELTVEEAGALLRGYLNLRFTVLDAAYL